MELNYLNCMQSKANKGGETNLKVQSGP